MFVWSEIKKKEFTTFVFFDATFDYFNTRTKKSNVASEKNTEEVYHYLYLFYYFQHYAVDPLHIRSVFQVYSNWCLLYYVLCKLWPVIIHRRRHSLSLWVQRAHLYDLGLKSKVPFFFWGVKIKLVSPLSISEFHVIWWVNYCICARCLECIAYSQILNKGFCCYCFYIIPSF